MSFKQTPKRRFAERATPYQKRPAKSTEIYDHYNGLFRMSYRLNDSASKLLNLYLDPAKNFEIMVSIGKPGFACVKLTPDQFDDIRELKLKALQFFDNRCAAKPAAEETTHGVRVKYESDWFQPVVKFSTTPSTPDPEEDDKSFVAVGKPTYENIIRYTDMYISMLGKLKIYQTAARLMYAKLVQALESRLPLKITHQIVEDKLLLVLGEESWMVEGIEGFSLIDQFMCYYELTLHCSKKMYAEVGKVE
jgi:hypothetical protein